ncbi:MAG: hypothetical protein ACRETW_01975 [Stenotrophobium sp.]
MRFNDLKNSALALALKTYLNEKFRNYGEVLDCEVDTVNGRASLHVRLFGEKEAISAVLERYELERNAAGVFVVLHSLSSSREWLTRLLNLLFAGKRFPIPAAIGALL